MARKIVSLHPKLVEPSLDNDRGYQAIRLRGLAGLLRATWGGHLQEVTNLDEVTFFVSSVLDEIAEKLDGGA